MKIILIALVLSLCLTGCGTQETFEIVEDPPVVEPVAVYQQFVVRLPEEAAAPTFQNDTGAELYVCQDYTISKQTFGGGDLEKTIKTLTGKAPEELQVIKTIQNTYDRYDFVWTAAGEEGLQLGRACILDDGNYHYTLSTLAQEAASGSLRKTFSDMYDSCRLISPDVNLHTGS